MTNQQIASFLKKYGVSASIIAASAFFLVPPVWGWLMGEQPVKTCSLDTLGKDDFVEVEGDTRSVRAVYYYPYSGTVYVYLND